MNTMTLDEFKSFYYNIVLPTIRQNNTQAYWDLHTVYPSLSNLLYFARYRQLERNSIETVYGLNIEELLEAYYNKIFNNALYDKVFQELRIGDYVSRAYGDIGKIIDITPKRRIKIELIDTGKQVYADSFNVFKIPKFVLVSFCICDK